MTIYDTDALTVGEEEDVVVVLGHSVRIHDISLSMSSSLEKSHAKVESSFPAPEQLHPCSPKSGEFVVLAGAFLGAGRGGTNTSRLCHLNFGRIYFPKFHNSFRLAGASFPSYLGTNSIVGDGFLSQQALTAALSATTQLKSLFISPDSETDPEQRSANPPPLANLLVLRALIGFRFVGSGEYLEQPIFRIYAPLLEGISLSWFQTDLDVLQLSQFISRIETADAVAPSHILRSL